MISDAKYLFDVYWSLYVLFGPASNQVLCLFVNQMFGFFCIKFYELLTPIILDINPLILCIIGVFLIQEVVLLLVLSFALQILF